MQAIGLVPSSATSSPSPGILFVPNFNPSLIGRPLLFSHSLRKLFGSFRLSGRREKSWREKCVSRENSSSRVIAVSIPSKELGVGMYMERKKREKAICFIVEKIILPVDRSNLVDLVTRISRDLKYSFNEILVDASWGIERRGITRSFFRYSNPEPVSHLNFPSSIIFCVRSEKVSALVRIPDIEKQSRTYVTIRMKRGWKSARVRFVGFETEAEIRFSPRAGFRR